MQLRFLLVIYWVKEFYVKGEKMNTFLVHFVTLELYVNTIYASYMHIGALSVVYGPCCHLCVALLVIIEFLYT